MCLYSVMTNYIRDMSPSGLPHQLSTGENGVVFKMLHNNYSPKANIVVGGLVAASDFWGTVLKLYTGRNERNETFVTIQGVQGNRRRRARRRLKNCVGVHPQNAFVRNNLSKIWYKIIRNQDHCSVLSAVLIDEDAEGHLCIYAL